jgi:hypothetical protein
MCGEVCLNLPTVGKLRFIGFEDRRIVFCCGQVAKMTDCRVEHTSTCGGISVL